MNTPIITTFFDRHLHLRRGDMLKLVTPHSAKYAWGAILMPNTSPHLLTSDDANQYQQEVTAVTKSGFVPYTACYLNKHTDPGDLVRGHKHLKFIAAKWYPKSGTTNSDEGVESVDEVAHILEVMESSGIPLLVHGEIPDDSESPWNFERNFMERRLPEIRSRFPRLKIVLEHITTSYAAQAVKEHENVWATVTPQHLICDERHLLQMGSIKDGNFKRGIRPNFWCMPVLQHMEHRESLLATVFESDKFGAGTDSAPHVPGKKYCDCGCGGCFTPYAVELYAMAAEEAGRLDALPAFLGKNLLKEAYGIKTTPNFAPKIKLEKALGHEPQTITSDGGVSVEMLPVQSTWRATIME